MGQKSRSRLAWWLWLRVFHESTHQEWPRLRVCFHAHSHAAWPEAWDAQHTAPLGAHSRAANRVSGSRGKERAKENPGSFLRQEVANTTSLDSSTLETMVPWACADSEEKLPASWISRLLAHLQVDSVAYPQGLSRNAPLPSLLFLPHPTPIFVLKFFEVSLFSAISWHLHWFSLPFT